MLPLEMNKLPVMLRVPTNFPAWLKYQKNNGKTKQVTTHLINTKLFLCLSHHMLLEKIVQIK
jgi:hypothetical protein